MLMGFVTTVFIGFGFCSCTANGLMFWATNWPSGAHVLTLRVHGQS